MRLKISWGSMVALKAEAPVYQPGCTVQYERGLITAVLNFKVTRIPRNSLVCKWVVVKIMVPFWVLSMIRHLISRGPKTGPQF